MAYNLKYKVDSAFVKKTAMRAVLTSHGGMIIALLLVLVICFRFMLQDYATALTYFISGGITVYIGTIVSSIVRALRTYKSVYGKTVTLIFDDDLLTFQSDDRSSSVKWASIARILTLKDAILIFPYRHVGICSMIPLSAMDKDAQTFFFKKVTEARKPPNA